MQAVSEAYESALKKQEFWVKCDRHSSAIELEMPTDSSWEVTSFTSPAKVSPHTHTLCIKSCILLYSQLDMDVVLQYQPGRAIPQVTLQIEWVGEGQPTERNVVVMLTGVHSPKSFKLQCTPSTANRG